MSEHAVTLFQKVKTLFNDKELNRTNLFKFLELAMEAVELNKDLSGAQKKALVIETIKLAVNEMIPDSEEFMIVEHYVNYFIDQTIDEIIEINGGKLKINPKKSKFYSCFSKCRCPLRLCGCFKGLFKATPAPAPVVAPVPVPAPAPVAVVVPDPATPVPVVVPAPVPAPVVEELASGPK